MSRYRIDVETVQQESGAWVARAPHQSGDSAIASSEERAVRLYLNATLWHLMHRHGAEAPPDCPACKAAQSAQEPDPAPNGGLDIRGRPICNYKRPGTRVGCGQPKARGHDTCGIHKPQNQANRARRGRLTPDPETA